MEMNTNKLLKVKKVWRLIAKLQAYNADFAMWKAE